MIWIFILAGAFRPIGQSHGSDRCNRQPDLTSASEQPVAGRYLSGLLFHLPSIGLLSEQSLHWYPLQPGIAGKTDVSMPFYDGTGH